MADDGTIKLGYDGKKVEAGFASLEARSKKSASAVEGSFSALSNRISGGLAAIGVGVSFGALKSLTSHFDDIADGAQRMGIGVESFQRLKHMADLSGSSVESLTTALVKMTAGLQRGGDDGDKLVEVLRSLGINVEQFKATDPEQQMRLLAAGFQKARAEGRGLAEVQDLFKKQFIELIPLLSLTAEEMAKISAEKIVSEEDVARLAKANDQIETFGNRIKVYFGEVLAAAIPVAEHMADSVSGIGDSMQGLSDRARVSSGLVAGLINDLNRLTGGGGSPPTLDKHLGGFTRPSVYSDSSPYNPDPIQGAREGTKEEKDAAKKAEARAKVVQAAEKELADARKRAALEQANDEGKLAIMKSRQTQIEAEAKKIGDDKVASLKLQVEYQELALEIARQEKTLADKKAEAEKKAADEKKTASRTAENQMRAARDLQTDIAIANEKDPKKKADLERQRRISDDQRRIMRDTGLGAADALAAANGLNPKGDEEETRTRSGRKKIHGYSAAQYATNPYVDHRSFNDFFHGGAGRKSGASVNGPGTTKTSLAEGGSMIEIQNKMLLALEKLAAY